MNKTIETVRQFREKLLGDPARPGYHFACFEDAGVPGDPNGAFFENGVYHLMYLYECVSDSFRWGHISSADLVHWRSHPDALKPDGVSGGIFSGGAFLDDDGTAYLSYWGLGANGNRGGIRLAKSNDRHYEKWEAFPDDAIPCTGDGFCEIDGKPVACADPSNIWKQGGVYYMQTGNYAVLHNFGLSGDSLSEYRGDWVDLFRSKDLIGWEYVHRFYQWDPSNRWTDETEDDMCPSFLPLPKGKGGGEWSGKYLQLFIAHNKGCQYYIGHYDAQNQLFRPESHGRMSYRDNHFFAPEALVDGKGRQIMWAWLREDPYGPQEMREKYGWCGIYSLPRSLWLREDGALGVAPVEELASLRINKKSFGSPQLQDGVKLPLEGIHETSSEIHLVVDMTNCQAVGLNIYESDGGQAATITLDKQKNIIFFDSNQPEELPFALGEDEKLDLTVYTDRSVIELFANERQASARRVAVNGNPTSISLFCAGGHADFKIVDVWEMMPSNPY